MRERGLHRRPLQQAPHTKQPGTGGGAPTQRAGRAITSPRRQPARALTTLAELQKDPRNLPASRGLRGDIYMNGNNFVAAAQAYIEDFNEAPRPDLVLRAANALGSANRPAEASRTFAESTSASARCTAATKGLGSMTKSTCPLRTTCPAWKRTSVR
jgi:predicted Zn-dependent protease